MPERATCFGLGAWLGLLPRQRHARRRARRRALRQHEHAGLGQRVVDRGPAPFAARRAGRGCACPKRSGSANAAPPTTVMCRAPGSSTAPRGCAERAPGARLRCLNLGCGRRGIEVDEGRALNRRERRVHGQHVLHVELGQGRRDDNRGTPFMSDTAAATKAAQSCHGPNSRSKSATRPARQRRAWPRAAHQRFLLNWRSASAKPRPVGRAFGGEP